jgi:hypothetical protein
LERARCRHGAFAFEIIEFNIQHFRALLETEKDSAKRATIERLFAEQEPLLAALVKKESD